MKHTNGFNDRNNKIAKLMKTPFNMIEILIVFGK